MPAPRQTLAVVLLLLISQALACRTSDELCAEDLRLARKAISKLDYRLAGAWRDKAAEHCSDPERVKKLSADIEKLKARRAKR
jgi:hypothetical protein